MRSRFLEALLVILAATAAAALVMFLIHLWRLPGLLTAAQPLARGAIAFFLGGAALRAARDVDDDGAGALVARQALRGIALLGLLAVYLVPTYCSFRHYRTDLFESSNPSANEFGARLTFQNYLHLVGTSQPVVGEKDVPEGDGFFDILVMIAMIVDTLIQKLFTGVLHLAIAGYVSLTVWYLMFVLFSYAGLTLFYDR